MTFREELKVGTAESHRKLDANSRIMRDDFGLAEYRRLLQNWAEFYAAFESSLEENSAQFVDAAAFMKGREKSGLLKNDLFAFDLKTSKDAIDDLKRSALFEQIFRDEPSLWAALYVLEGSTLGGQVLAKRLRTHFSDAISTETHTGFEFYASYGEQTGTYWRGFIGKLESLGFDGMQKERGVATAQALFDFFSHYLES